jgi:2-amino-4-hydroxy-6-hydroxymethyldihydropteridine diphosphokinase
MVQAFIGLGSNLDDPILQVEQAIFALQYLPATQFIQRSRLYETAPIGMLNQPNFINAVALIETQLTPHDLLAQLLAIEQQQFRQRDKHNQFGPRTLDCDLLLYGNQIINEPDLTIPHPRMLERAFVLVPLQEIAPDLVLPHGKTVAEYLAALSPQSVQQI